MDISAEIAAIQAASQGSELRQPLVGALNKLNSNTLPAVTVSDVGKILKVGANGWEVGEKSGYMPVPTATKQITENGTYDVMNYASAFVSVSGGSAGTLISRTITQNGTYNAIDDNADGYSDVIVSVPSDPINRFAIFTLSNSITPWINKNNNSNIQISANNKSLLFRINGTFSNSNEIIIGWTLTKSQIELFVGKYMNFKLTGTYAGSNINFYCEKTTSPWERLATVNPSNPKSVISPLPDGDYTVNLYSRIISSANVEIDAYIEITITDL